MNLLIEKKYPSKTSSEKKQEEIKQAERKNDCIIANEIVKWSYETGKHPFEDFSELPKKYKEFIDQKRKSGDDETLEDIYFMVGIDDDPYELGS